MIFHRGMPPFQYVRPKTLKEAFVLLSQKDKGRAKVFAGGTDLFPKLKRREVKIPGTLVDLKGIPDLNYIQYDEKKGLRLGPLTTLHAIERSRMIRDKYGLLAQAAHSIGSPQIRNRGTIAGNICNAVPSADSAPALLVLGTRLMLQNSKGKRTVKIEDFFKGPNATILSNGELLREIQVPPLPKGSRGLYLKVSPRRSMDLAVVGAAVLVILDKGVCKDVRVALGAVSPTPIRAQRAEEILRGQPFSDRLVEEAAHVASEEARPIDDHRASANYRRRMIEVLVRRAIREVWIH